ncbi:MAG: hypothetical protein A2033_15810 [Bacteroidetes bacterium GWA2_31_9]|nr:MAG: hypothetical protein A2033_15810 [Bacteroidetes bacterium GWA2_31_9]
MKKILVIYYSQSGQLKQILDNICLPFEKNQEISITWHKIKPVNDFPFPWKADEFFNAMPESVKGTPFEIDSTDLNTDENYDLIIFGYAVWYLSPSIPTTSFLKTEIAKKLFANKKVITVIACRNMWTNAHKTVINLISESGGKTIGNVALSDKTNNLVSVITIYQWMVKGIKEKYMNIFPMPGVSDADINKSIVFGKSILKMMLGEISEQNLQQDILKNNKESFSLSLALIEKTAIRIFNIWANFILKKGDYNSTTRLTRVRIFKYYLFIVIFVVLPFAQLFFSSILLLNPVLKRKLIKRFASPDFNYSQT